MASKPKFSLAALPRSEICAYWVLSFGSHLYSFYELHRFSKGVIGGACNLFNITTLVLNDHEESKCCDTTDNSVEHLIPEHEAGLEREFQLQKGFLGGFKRDPNDFEWSFWSNWAKKSLMCTLFGHAVISKLSSILVPKLKVSVIAGYGLLVACGTLGIKGVGVIMVHLGLSLVVAQFCRPSMSWCCALLLLSTLHIPPLQELKRSWYETEEEYYLLLFSVAVCGLRFISFSLDHCWRPLEAARLEQIYWLTAYSFYHPLFYNGPIITFKDFVEQMQRPAEKSDGRRTLLLLVAKAGRIVMWWLTAEYMIHFMYMHTIQSNETYLEILPPWALGGLALALVQFFYVKYLVLFGLPSLLATLDNLVPPKLPRCVSIMYSFTGMWRHFDEGLYQWLIRYVYVPLGGSHHGPLWKVLSTGLAFGFVCLWHGGHDYLQYWALMNWAGVLVENGLRAFLTSPFILPSIERGLSAPARRRCGAVLFAVSTAMLILSNLVFLGGIHVGRIFWKRVVIQGWPMMVPSMLAFLYCFAQIGLEWKNNYKTLSL